MKSELVERDAHCKGNRKQSADYKVTRKSCRTASFSSTESLVSVSNFRQSFDNNMTIAVETGNCEMLHPNDQELANPNTYGSLWFPMRHQLSIRDMLRLKPPLDSNLKYEIVDIAGCPCKNYQMVVNLEGLTDFDSETDRLAVHVYSANTSLCLETLNGHQIFYRDSLAIFNVYVSTQSPDGTSIMTMESLTEDHWVRLHEVISVSSFFHRLMSVDASFQWNNNKPTLILSNSSHKYCKNISEGIESFLFFNNLSLEDQIIVLKESFSMITVLLFSYAYDEAEDSFIFTALKNKLLFCLNKNRYSTVEFGNEMHEFNCSFLSNFATFLRKDFFVITILCILCILEDKPGLSCIDIFEKERSLYTELLDHYIRAKVASEAWNLDRDSIWSHIHRMMKEVFKYSSIRMKFVKDRESLEVSKQYSI